MCEGVCEGECVCTCYIGYYSCTHHKGCTSRGHDVIT